MEGERNEERGENRAHEKWHHTIAIGRIGPTILSMLMVANKLEDKTLVYKEH